MVNIKTNFNTTTSELKLKNNNNSETIVLGVLNLLTNYE